MNYKDQKQIFKKDEGDAFFERTDHIQNERFSNLKNESDVFSTFINDLSMIYKGDKINVLEIGCGNGSRLAAIKRVLNCNVFGIDPSIRSVESALKKGVFGQVGTADELPFENNKFDVLIFGFCLYLCDRNDLFKIAYEADRVLKPSSWLVIIDFWSNFEKKLPYKHNKDIYTYKFDYPSIFTWNPSYNIFNHNIRADGKKEYTDNQSEWVATTILRRKEI